MLRNHPTVLGTGRFWRWQYRWTNWNQRSMNNIDQVSQANEPTSQQAKIMKQVGNIWKLRSLDLTTLRTDIEWTCWMGVFRSSRQPKWSWLNYWRKLMRWAALEWSCVNFFFGHRPGKWHQMTVTDLFWLITIDLCYLRWIWIDSENDVRRFLQIQRVDECGMLEDCCIWRRSSSDNTTDFIFRGYWKPMSNRFSGSGIHWNQQILGLCDRSERWTKGGQDSISYTII